MVLGLGVGGAAFATVLAQGLSALVCIICCFSRCSELKMTREDIRADRKMMAKCIGAGLPIAAQNGLISVSMVALQRVTNGFGETVMAAYTVSMRIEQFIQQPFSSLNAAVSTFTGQNIGAGRSDRAVKGMVSAIKISVIFAFAVLVIFILFGKAITGIFVSGSDVIFIASRAIVLTGCFYWSLGIIHTVRGFFKRCRRHRICPCERHGGGHLPNRAFNSAHLRVRNRSLGHMAHHLLHLVCNGGSQPYEI